jgi:hypothetical protein
MQKVYTSRQQMLLDLSENSNIDYEKTFRARELAFVTKDGKEFWSPVWHLYIKSLIENADAKLVHEGCHKYPRSYILLFKDEGQEVESQQEKEELVEPQTDKEEVVDSETEEQEVKKPRGRQPKK